MSRACITVSVVLFNAAALVAADGDKLEFTADADTLEDVAKEASREVISREVDLDDTVKRDRPAAAAQVPPATTAIGPRIPLMRKWDLNGDGRIDEGEAEVARVRMRRERREMQREAGNDPLTGLPRYQKETADVIPDETAGRAGNGGEKAEMSTEEGSAGEDDDDSPRLPGTTTPRLVIPMPTPKQPEVGLPQGIPRVSIYTRPRGQAYPSSGPAGGALRHQVGGQVGARGGSESGPDADPKAGLGARAGWTGRWTQPLTGGARAGAPPATAGYGAAGPKRDLNAGRYREEVPSLRGLTPRLDVSGGLLPTVRQPRQPVAPPVAPLVKPPRLTAEDIGGF